MAGSGENPEGREGGLWLEGGLEARGPAALDKEVQGAEGAAGRQVDLLDEQDPRRAWAPRGLDHPSQSHQVGQSRKTRHAWTTMTTITTRTRTTTITRTSETNIT